MHRPLEIAPMRLWQATSRCRLYRGSVNTPPDPFLQQGSDRKRHQTSWVGLAGIAIGLVGLGFALYALANGWDELANADLAPRTLAVAVFVGIAGMTTIGLNWIRIMRRESRSVRLRNGMRWYFVGQLGKYIPGGVWAILGRGELATKGGVGRAVAYTSVGVSLVTTYAAAAVVGALMLAVSASSLGSRIAWIALSAATVVGAVFSLTEPVVRRISRLASRFGFIANVPSTTPRESLMAIAMTVPAWLCIGTATAQVGAALGFSVNVGQVIAATSYSWLAGFLVVPMPGGLGVREAVFIALYSGATDEAAVIAVIARILFVLVDVTGAAAFTVVGRLVGRR